MRAITISKVIPKLFDGDVRNLPQVPQPERIRPELEPPFQLQTPFA